MTDLKVTEEVGGVRCFSGISTTAAVRPEYCDYLSFSSYTAVGANRALSEAGLLDIVPCHYSQLPDILGRGPLRADVLFLALPQAAPTARSAWAWPRTTWPRSSAGPAR